MTTKAAGDTLVNFPGREIHHRSTVCPAAFVTTLPSTTSPNQHVRPCVTGGRSTPLACGSQTPSGGCVCDGDAPPRFPLGPLARQQLERRPVEA